jgi:RNA polymerase sigma-70 factor (ECF subfamily)
MTAFRFRAVDPHETASSAFVQPSHHAVSALAAIVARAQAGDKAAAAAIVERYERSLRVVLARLIANPADRDDLLQDVWVVALTKIRRGELREPDHLFGFLAGTARGLAANERRRCNRRATDPDVSAIDQHPDDSAEPSAAIERAQCRQLTMTAIRSLRPKHYREVLLRSVADQDKSQTCAELGIDTIQYSKLFFRAKGRLKAVINETTTAIWIAHRHSRRV